MKKLTLYGSDKCSHCGPFKEKLEKAGVEFKWVNITDSMANLKEFLKYRDERAEFEEVRKDGRVGIPCLVVNDGEEIIHCEPDEVLSRVSTCGFDGC